MISNTTIGRRFAAISLAALMGLASCGGEDESGSVSIASDGDESASSGIEYLSEEENETTYEPGMCLTFDDSGIDEAVDCSTPHQLEVVGVIRTPFEAVPAPSGTEFIEICAPVVEDYTDGEGIGEGLKVARVNYVGLEGDTVEGTVDEGTVCLAQSPPGLNFDDSVAGGVAKALGDYISVRSLEPGECFELYQDYYYLGTSADCDSTEALVYLGSVDVEDAGEEYPGEDELSDIRDEECPKLAEELERFNADDASGTVPAQDDWRAGVDYVLCDVVSNPTR